MSELTSITQLPLTVQHDGGIAPNWYPHYPPAIDLNGESDFYKYLADGIVTVYYYNCGVRQEQRITGNPEWAPHAAELVELQAEGTTGFGTINEDNRIRAGECSRKPIVGWSTNRTLDPDNPYDKVTFRADPGPNNDDSFSSRAALEWKEKHK